MKKYKKNILRTYLVMLCYLSIHNLASAQTYIDSVKRYDPRTLYTNKDTVLMRIRFSNTVKITSNNAFALIGMGIFSIGTVTVSPTDSAVYYARFDVRNISNSIFLSLNNIGAIRTAGTNMGFRVGANRIEGYIIDRTPPSVVLSAPQSMVTNGGKLTITATFTENTLLKKNPKITISGVSNILNAILKTTADPKIFTYDWIIPHSHETATISITASDTAGNVNTSATGTTVLFSILENTTSSSDSVYNGTNTTDLVVGYLQRKNSNRTTDSVFYKKNYAFILTAPINSGTDNIRIYKVPRIGTSILLKTFARGSAASDTLSFLSHFGLNSDSIGIYTFKISIIRNGNETNGKEVSIANMGIRLSPERRMFQRNEQKTIHIITKKTSSLSGNFTQPINGSTIKNNSDTLSLFIPTIAQSYSAIPIQYRLTRGDGFFFTYDTFHINIKNSPLSFSQTDTFCFRNNSYILPIKNTYIPKTSTDTILKIFNTSNQEIYKIKGADTILAFTPQKKYIFIPKNLKKHYAGVSSLVFKFFRIEKNDTIQMTSDEYKINELPQMKVTIPQDNCIYDRNKNITYSINGTTQGNIHKNYTLQKKNGNLWTSFKTLSTDSISFSNPKQDNTLYNITHESDTFRIIYTSLSKPSITHDNCVNTDTSIYRVWKRPNKPDIEHSQYYTDSSKLTTLYYTEERYDDKIYSVTEQKPTSYRWYRSNDTTNNYIIEDSYIAIDSIKLKNIGTNRIYTSKIQYREGRFDGCESFKSSINISVFKRALSPFLVIKGVNQTNPDGTAKDITLIYCKDSIPDLLTVSGYTSLFNTKNRYFNWYQKITKNNKDTLISKITNLFPSEVDEDNGSAVSTEGDLNINRDIRSTHKNDTLQYLVTQINTVIPNQYPGTESKPTKITIILLGNPPQLSVDTFSYCATDALKTIKIKGNRIPNSQIKWYWGTTPYSQDSITPSILLPKIPINTTSSDQKYDSLKVEQIITIGSKSCKSQSYSVEINRFAKPINFTIDSKEFGSCYIGNKSIEITDLPTSNNLYKSNLHIIYNNKDSLLYDNITSQQYFFHASKAGTYKIYTISKVHKNFLGCISDTIAFTIYQSDSIKIKYKNLTTGDEKIAGNSLQLCPENIYSFNAYYPYQGKESDAIQKQAGFKSSKKGFVEILEELRYKANAVTINEFIDITYDTITYTLPFLSCSVTKNVIVSILPRPQITLTAYKYFNNEQPIPISQFCFDTINSTQTKIRFQMEFKNNREFNNIGIESAKFNSGIIGKKEEIFQISNKRIIDPYAFSLKDVFYDQIGTFKPYYEIVTSTGCKTTEYANQILNNPNGASFVTSKAPTPKFIVQQQPTKNQEVIIEIPQGTSGEFNINITELDSVILKIQNKYIKKEKISNNTDNIRYIKYTFTDTSKQNISLTMVSLSKCATTASKILPVLSVVTVTPTIPYKEDFNKEKSLWIVDNTILFGIAGINDPFINYKSILDPNDPNYKITIRENSWKIGILPNTNNSTKAFVTTNANYKSSSGSDDSIKNTYYKNENSWVFSPAFDISKLNRPMVSFMLSKKFQANTEGVVFQYTTDNGITWYNLGTYRSGVNWYNSKNVTNRPGEINAVDNNFNAIGWANNNQSDSKWVYTAHKLDEIPLNKRPFVRFRFAIASDANDKSPEYPGFGFDDFFIGERQGMSILEKFTYFKNNRVVDSTINTILSNPLINNQDIIQIAYHTDIKTNKNYPIDPLFLSNMADPGARINFYGVVNVPTSIINGSLDPTYYNPEPQSNIPWSKIDIQKNQLTPPNFSISINSLPTSSNDSIQLAITVKPNNSSIPITSNIRIYILAIQSESTIDNIKYKNVVRKIIPNALGIPINKSQSLYKQAWKIDPFLITEPQNLKVAAFIQNIDTKEIYNTDTIGIPRSSINIPILAQIQKENQKNIHIYPNPAHTELTIELKNNHPKETQWKIESITGKTILQGSYTNSKNPYKINTAHIPNGTYILNIYQLHTIISTEKIIIHHTK